MHFETINKVIMNGVELSYDKKFWLRWLDKYKCLRCLWDVDSQEYTNRKKRSEAYLELRNMAKQINPEADEAFVKARINGFRTSYRREAKKVIAAKKKGESYEPTLFYYNHLNSMFQLDNNDDKIFDNTSEISDASDSEDPFAISEIKQNIDCTEETYEIENLQQQGQGNKTHINIEELNGYEDDYNVNRHELVYINSKRKKSIKRKIASKANLDDDESNHQENSIEYCEHSESQLIQGDKLESYHRGKKRRTAFKTYIESPALNDSIIETGFKAEVKPNSDDECDMVGRRIASHLQKMNPKQRLITERIICDVCIHGRMDKLTWESTFLVSNSLRQTKS